jgi:hypothetical protein
MEMTMKVAAKFAVLCLGGSLLLGAAGCDNTHDTMRPDPDTVMRGEHGLQSADLRQMTSKLAPDILQIPEIVQSPYRAVIVVKGVQNKTEDMPGRNLDIYAARLAGLLNQAAARDRVVFVEERANLENLQNQELGNRTPNFEDASRTGQVPQDPRQQPQYALYGTFYSQNNGRTTYYLCQFQLTDLRTGVKVWGPQQYEVRTLN